MKILSILLKFRKEYGIIKNEINFTDLQRKHKILKVRSIGNGCAGLALWYNKDKINSTALQRKHRIILNGAYHWEYRRQAEAAAIMGNVL